MTNIPTWHERAMAHPDHQTGVVSEDMIRARMCEEIEDLRAEVERLRTEKDKLREIDRLVRRRMAEAWDQGNISPGHLKDNPYRKKRAES